jgi:hypothetical protein
MRTSMTRLESSLRALRTSRWLALASAAGIGLALAEPAGVQTDSQTDDRASSLPARSVAPVLNGRDSSSLSGPAESRGIRQLSENRFQLGAIEFDRLTREIFLSGEVNMVDGTLEYVVVTKAGKVHESLLSTEARPFDLNLVLLLLNYTPAEDWFVPGSKPKPLGEIKPAARCDILARWKNPEGEEQTTRLERWITNRATRQPANDGPWVYNGSTMTEDGRFAAEVDGSIAAVYLDQRSLVNNPRPGHDDDELWVPAKDVPPRHTPVTIIIRPAVEVAPRTPAPRPPPPNGARSGRAKPSPATRKK